MDVLIICMPVVVPEGSPIWALLSYKKKREGWLSLPLLWGPQIAEERGSLRLPPLLFMVR